jgi:hypothetical protein
MALQADLGVEGAVFRIVVRDGFIDLMKVVTI